MKFIQSGNSFSLEKVLKKVTFMSGYISLHFLMLLFHNENFYVFLRNITCKSNEEIFFQFHCPTKVFKNVVFENLYICITAC